ncbi:MAG: hypothetical protein JF591_22075 [Lysobacter sp.]|nr:hypothetical protein [Lysobacter sp.]
MAAVEQALQAAHADRIFAADRGLQTVVGSIGCSTSGLRQQRQQLILLDRQGRASAAVLRVVAAVARDHHVQRIVAAEQEHAHQRLVVVEAGRPVGARRRLDQAQIAERRVQAGAAERGHDRIAQEFTTFHHGVLQGRVTSAPRIRAS